jgi:hypothetical protein
MVDPRMRKEVRAMKRVEKAKHGNSRSRKGKATGNKKR